MRVIALAAALFLLGGPAYADGGEWTPDQALVAKIEATFAPMMAAGLTDPGDHSAAALAPLDKYTRYYAGETTEGERVVVGSFVFGFGRDEPAGIHVVTMKELPSGAGGGCRMVHIWYHVATGKVESICNFPM